MFEEIVPASMQAALKEASDKALDDLSEAGADNIVILYTVRDPRTAQSVMFTRTDGCAYAQIGMVADYLQYRLIQGKPL